VHYVHFTWSTEAIERFADGPAWLVVDHPAYDHEVELSEATRRELLQDLRGA
jgi:hypothetical protein